MRMETTMTLVDWLLLFFLVVILVIAFDLVTSFLVKPLLRLRLRRRDHVPRFTSGGIVPKPPTAKESVEADLFELIQQNTCPDCLRQGFYAGPSGGMAQNIYCMNPRCRSAFNVTSFGFCERIGKHDLSRYPVSETEKEALAKEDQATASGSRG